MPEDSRKWTGMVFGHRDLVATEFCIHRVENEYVAHGILTTASGNSSPHAYKLADLIDGKDWRILPPSPLHKLLGDACQALEALETEDQSEGMQLARNQRKQVVGHIRAFLGRAD